MIISQFAKQGELYNLLKLIRQTVVSDSKTYQVKERKLSSNRLFSLLVPNLHKPIFIVGAPRSGTTFLGSCLAEIPEISYHFEPIGTKIAARYIYEGKWRMAKAKRLYKSVYAWLMRVHLDADLRFAEKTPRNCFAINFLSQVFPDAQFVHIIRDGRDAALSYSKKPWLQAAQAKTGKYEPGGYQYGPYARFWVEPDRVKEFEMTSDIHRCIWAWRRFTESALEAASSLTTNQYYELRYEALVTKPREEADRLLDFLEIEDSISRSIFYKATAKARLDSVNQWQRELSKEQLQQIETEAGKLLNKLGYV